MKRFMCFAAVAAAVYLFAPMTGANAESLVERGRYLVAVGGCSDCHTPGSMLGHPNMKEFLGGSDVAFAIPGLGEFVPPNLTSDKETGLGSWTAAQVVTAITTGKRPDGRILAPIMPWRGLSHLTHQDALAIATFLKSLPPVHHQVPGPFGPDEKVSTFVSVVLPPQVYNNMPKPGKPPEHH